MTKLKKIYRKSLLYKTGVEYGDYCLNHVLGCSHGCRYPCYAMIMKQRYGQISGYQEWIKPKIVGNALKLLDKEIPKLKHKIDNVHLCFTTDPFMYGQPEVEELTLKIIARLNQAGIRCIFLTKGVYPDELLNKAKFRADNEYGITLVSLDKEFQTRYEPYSAPFRERIEALKKLHDAGLKTWVSMEPYPTPNIVKQDLIELLSEIGFADRIIFGRWNYNPLVSQFKDAKRFYNECADQIAAFCKEKEIRWHIKEGTDTRAI